MRKPRPGQLGTYFPCCNKRSVYFPLSDSATLVFKRTCPRCTERWQIIVRPSRKIDGGVMNLLDWTRINHESHKSSTTPRSTQ